MKRSLLVCVALLFVSSAYAAEVVPGTLRVVEECDKEIKAEPNDVVEIRISNPALPKRVHDVRVEAKADAVLAGVANTTNGLPGGDRISIFVGLKSAARSGTVEYSYKDGDDQEHTCKLIVHVIKSDGP